MHLQWAGSVTGYGEQPQRKYLWNLPKMSPSILWDHFNQVTYIGACERDSGGLTWSFFEFSKAMFLRYLGLVLRLDGSLVVTLHLKVSVITRHVSPQAWSTWWQGNYSLSFKTWSFNASFMNIVLYSFTSTFSQYPTLFSSLTYWTNMFHDHLIWNYSGWCSPTKRDSDKNIVKFSLFWTCSRILVSPQKPRSSIKRSNSSYPDPQRTNSRP